MIFRILIFCLLPTLGVKAQLIADFETTEGDFSVELFFGSAPLACANFVLLSGKGDDVWETPSGAASFTSTRYNTVRTETDVLRPQLNVRFRAADPAVPGSIAQYDIYQQLNTYLGSVSTFPDSFGNLSDVTGRGRFEMKQIEFNPNKFQIRFKYRRPWLDSRFQTIREAPMYQSIPITRVVRGNRFYSGSFTNSDSDNPGYHFQEESVVPQSGGVADWVLAMDNTGINTNGCRFFIASASDPELGNKYTVFGSVLSNAGKQVVINIANSEVNGEGVPDEPMFIQNITFRRGLEALNFFESYQQNFLPGAISPLPFCMEYREGNLSLVPALRPQSQTITFSSFDLQNYQPLGLLSQPPLITEAPATDLSLISAFAPKAFFKGFSTELPSWPSGDFDFKGKRFRFNVESDGGAGFLILNFDPGGTAAFYQVNTTISGDATVGSGNVGLSYSSAEGPYKGKIVLTILTGPLEVDEIVMHFERLPGGVTPVIGSFSATQSDDGPSYSGYYAPN